MAARPMNLGIDHKPTLYRISRNIAFLHALFTDRYDLHQKP